MRGGRTGFSKNMPPKCSEGVARLQSSPVDTEA